MTDTTDESTVWVWDLTKEVEWDEPTISRPNGRWRTTFEATDAQERAIEAAVNDHLNSGKGLLEEFCRSETKILRKWRPCTHPKVAVPGGAKRGRPRDEDNMVRRLQAHPLFRDLSRATLYRMAAKARENDRKQQVGET